jgi:uncharacterized protein DUF5719
VREGWDHRVATRRRIRGRWRRSRLVARSLVVGLAVAVVGGSGFLLDRTLGGGRLPSLPPRRVSSGTWFCAHGGSPGWQAWVVLANPGRRPVALRLTSFGENGELGQKQLSLPAQSEVYSEVPAGEAAASTEVEYFGGWVGAGAVMTAAKGKPGLAATECAPSSRGHWFLLDEPTGRSETGYAVVMNPFFAPAEFDVVIRTPRRSIRPSVLTPYVLGPRRSIAIKVNSYALEAPGEETITVEVTARIGRVVAGSLGIVPEGIRAESGVSTEKRLLLPAAASEPSTLALVNPGTIRAGLSVAAEESGSEQELFERPPLRVPSGGVLAEDLGKVKGAGLVVEVTNGRKIAASVVAEGTGKDSATIGGVHRTDNKWMVLPGTPPEGGKEFLILQNPSRMEGSVRLSFLGPEGPFLASGMDSVRVPAGRTVQVEVPAGPSGKPLTVLVDAGRGTVVAAEASHTKSDVGYAVALGVPMTGAR